MYPLTNLGQGWDMKAFDLILYLKNELGFLSDGEHENSLQLGVYYLLQNDYLNMD